MSRRSYAEMAASGLALEKGSPETTAAPPQVGQPPRRAPPPERAPSRENEAPSQPAPTKPNRRHRRQRAKREHLLSSVPPETLAWLNEIPKDMLVYGVAGPVVHDLASIADHLPVEDIHRARGRRCPRVRVKGPIPNLRERLARMQQHHRAAVLFNSGRAYNDQTGIMPDVLVVDRAAYALGSEVLSLWESLFCSPVPGFVTVDEFLHQWIMPYAWPDEDVFLVPSPPSSLAAEELITLITHTRALLRDYFARLERYIASKVRLVQRPSARLEFADLRSAQETLRDVTFHNLAVQLLLVVRCLQEGRPLISYLPEPDL